MLGRGVTSEAAVALYRAVSAAEREEALASQVFRPGPNSMEGKWFARNAGHAAEWGKRFYSEDPFYILEMEVPTSYVERLYSSLNLDGIGPAVFAEDLAELNQVLLSISEYVP
jgi:hypothetical protein